jgi:hypothetical protein
MSKKIIDVWTVVYKEENRDPKSYSYESEKDAIHAKKMIEEGDGEKLVNESGDIEELMKIEWCYLISAKLKLRLERTE